MTKISDKNEVKDMVNSPAHYQGLSNLYIKDFNDDFVPAQVIDVITAFVKHLDGNVAVNMGNAIKYEGRGGKKESDTADTKDIHHKIIQDWKKSIWYIEQAIIEYQKNNIDAFTKDELFIRKK